MVLFCICPVAADGDERERRVGGEREREREREKGGSMSFSRFGNNLPGTNDETSISAQSISTRTDGRYRDLEANQQRSKRL